MSATNQTVKVRHAFSSGHGEQLTSEASAKENTENVASGLALRERFIQVNQRLLVSFDQLFDACVQTNVLDQRRLAKSGRR